MWTDAENARSQTKVVLDQSSSGFAASGSVGIDLALDFTVCLLGYLLEFFSFLPKPSSVCPCQFSGAFFGVGPQIKLGALGVQLDTGYAGKTESNDVTNQGGKNAASINKETSVHTYLEAINPLFAYKVQPFVVRISNEHLCDLILIFFP